MRSIVSYGIEPGQPVHRWNRGTAAARQSTVKERFLQLIQQLRNVFLTEENLLSSIYDKAGDAHHIIFLL